MNLRSMRAVCVGLTFMSSPHLVADDGWSFPDHQYRIPIDVDAQTAGWSVVPLEETDISQAISKIEPWSFDPIYTAYNHVRVQAVDERGIETGPVEAGFYLIPDNRELVRATTAPIPTRRNNYYLVRFVSEGGQFPPTINYEPVFPIGSPPRSHSYRSSYVPRLLPRTRQTHECLMRSDGSDLNLNVTLASDISVQRVDVAFLANFPSAGRKRLAVYYQPLGAHYLKIPELRRDARPATSTTVPRIGAAQKRLGETQYSLPSTGPFRLWFAATTVKLQPETPRPSQTGPSIRVRSAANESQSFQLILSPSENFTFAALRVSDLRKADHSISASNVEVRALAYVPVTEKAVINQVAFFGKIADPLVPVRPRRINAEDENAGFWVTIRTPPKTPAGTYSGSIDVVYDRDKSSTVPVTFEVYDFALPEYSTFRSNMGGQYLVKNSGDAKLNPIANYHGIKTKADLKKLARAYYTAMAREKFYPKTPMLFEEIGVKWDRPPKGLNVDAPDNFFRLYDWDFTAFNEEARYFIEELKVNSVCLTHTNPSVSHIFKHLPGDPLDRWNSDPGHVTMGWQTFRKMTQVTYAKQAGDPWFDTSLEVTRKQWDRLVLDYYRAIAKNVAANGWLDKFYVFVDETSGTDKILHLVRLLKSDPLTAQIRIAHCLQGFESLRHQEGGDYAFTKHLTYVPQIDENYFRWEPYYWADYDVPRERDRLWSYAAYSSRLGINVPGMTNREVGLEVFQLGGSGFVIWDTIMWHHPYGHADDPHNPWVEPYARLANGALSFFYPPRRAGFPTKPDFTITPSLRIATFREGVDDYEYARILEDLIAEGEHRGVNVADGRAVLSDVAKLYPSSSEWTLNDAWYLDVRKRMAEAIVALKRRLSVDDCDL